MKSILLACDQDDVIDALVADLQNYERGTQHDETQWLDVGLHACKQLNARRKVIFLTAFEARAAESAEQAGLRQARIGQVRVPHEPLPLLWPFGQFAARGSQAAARCAPQPRLSREGKRDA